MTEKRKFAIIGAGVMGEAIIKGLINNDVVSPGDIVGTCPRSERLQILSEKYRIQTNSDNALAIENADVVLLCIKPQVLPEVLSELKDLIPKNSLLISIVAGASIETLQRGLNHHAVVRSMPNTPAQVGEGMTVWTENVSTSQLQHQLTKEILGALGQQIFVKDERYIDMATAVSGTGPAYVFLFLESMIDAGVHLGLPRRVAEDMVIQTIKGSIEYYAKNDSHPARLRNQVTSPGGTSATALYYLEKMGFRTAISRAIWAAFTRSQELGKGQNYQDPEKI
jgi:pyrroline-5-carboxylate reductase